MSNLLLNLKILTLIVAKFFFLRPNICNFHEIDKRLNDCLRNPPAPLFK